MKKLLLILLCLPMIGFGQEDKIIFSSGDIIYGKVIEVSVNDITYQHKGETTNYISKKRDIAKVIYSSGRVENFEGLKVIEKRKKVLFKTKQINNNLGEYQKSNHSIMLGPSTNIDYFYYTDDNWDRTAIGFDLNYSYSIAIQSFWRYSTYFTFNYLREERTRAWSNLTFGDAIDPQDGFVYDSAIPSNYSHTNYYYNFFIGQKFGHIHNKYFSTYIGSSIRLRKTIGKDDISHFLELEERFSFINNHFIFLNIRTKIFQQSSLINSNTTSFQVVESTIGYGIKF